VKRNEIDQAARMGIKPKTLANWRSLGSGPPFYKVGARVVYDDADVDAWLATRKRTSTTQQTAA
jgi:hypothetical protein